MTKQKWYKGDTFGKKLEFQDEIGAYIDPDAITTTIKKPDGTTADTLAKLDLTKTETGKYKLYWLIPTDAALGLWSVEVYAVAGAYKNTEKFAFNVVG